jgi:hypothetical protein
MNMAMIRIAKAFFISVAFMGAMAGFPVNQSRAQSVAATPVLTQAIADKITSDWAQAINSGNVQAWMELHADKVEFANHSWFTGKSRAEMRPWGTAVVNAGGVYRILEHRIENGQLIWMIDYKDRSFAIREMGRVNVSNGKITRLILGPLPRS